MQTLKFSVNKIQNRIMSFYAVAIGRETGIYDTWSKCEEQVKGFKGARYKKFPTRSAAEEFINNHGKSMLTSKISVADRLSKQIPAMSNADSNDFWPPSDGDTFDENQLTDDDLLTALANVEGLLQSSSKLKRRNDAESQTTTNCSKRMKNESKISEPAGLKQIGEFKFQIDTEGYVVVYTDGSCFNNGRENACAGYGVYFGYNHPMNISRPVNGRVTNNVGEIQASIHAIKSARSLGITKLCINTDSQFLINSVTMWIKGWKTKNWRLKNGEPVKNVIDFKELDNLLCIKDIDVKWNYVAAHRGIEGNEMADRLAREGSETYKRLHLKT